MNRDTLHIIPGDGITPFRGIEHFIEDLRGTLLHAEAGLKPGESIEIELPAMCILLMSHEACAKPKAA